ncbi:MAG: hypothetical protein WCR75_04150, partial [Sphaerochaetaceae bacterium]
EHQNNEFFHFYLHREMTLLIGYSNWRTNAINKFLPKFLLLSDKEIGDKEGKMDETIYYLDMF